MGRCSNAVLMNKIGINKLTDQTEVTFSITRDANNCEMINTRCEINGAGTYNPYYRPTDMFNCDAADCTTTGALIIDGTTATKAEFFHAFDAEEYSVGLITMYVIGIGSGNNTWHIAVSADSTFTDSDVYEQQTAASNTWVPLTVDLSQTPTSTTGNGYTANNSGVYIRVSSGTNDDKAFTISTISFYRSTDDVAQSTIVKIGCLSEVGGTFDLSALEETCLSSGYDKTTIPSFDWTITGKKLTSNYWMLNPLTGMNRYPTGRTENGYKIATVKKKVENGGTFTINNVNPDICDFYGVQVDDPCATSDVLTRIFAGHPAYDQFSVSLSEQNNGTYNAIFLVNASLAGLEVNVTYPEKWYEYEVHEGDFDNVGDVHVKMSYPVKLSDGTEEIHTFNNVLVTSFPATLSSDEQDITFTINVQRDRDGKYFVVRKLEQCTEAASGGSGTE